jgi:hypothetical protein
MRIFDGLISVRKRKRKKGKVKKPNRIEWETNTKCQQIRIEKGRKKERKEGKSRGTANAVTNLGG